FADIWVLDEDLFDVFGEDVHSTGLDHLLDTPGDEQESFVVLVSHIAAANESATVRGDPRAGTVDGIVSPVTQHHSGSVPDDLTDFVGGKLMAVLADDAHVIEQERLADRTGEATPVLGKTQ